MNRRLTELGMRQRDLAERAHVSQASCGSCSATPPNARSARTLEACRWRWVWHPRHLQAVLAGEQPPDRSDPIGCPPTGSAGRLAAIEAQLRAIENRLIDVRPASTRDRGRNGVIEVVFMPSRKRALARVPRW